MARPRKASTPEFELAAVKMVAEQKLLVSRHSDSGKSPRLVLRTGRGAAGAVIRVEIAKARDEGDR